MTNYRRDSNFKDVSHVRSSLHIQVDRHSTLEDDVKGTEFQQGIDVKTFTLVCIFSNLFLKKTKPKKKKKKKKKNKKKKKKK
jgi:hypothetical protein